MVRAMRIRVLSDLHLELWPFMPPELLDSAAPKGKDLQDVVVLAGDIHHAEKAVLWARENFADVPCVQIQGNHEGYGLLWSRAALRMRNAAIASNVHFLDNDVTVIQGVRFLGCTLFTDFDLFGGDENRAHAIASAKRCMSDFSTIFYGSTGFFTPEQSVLLHLNSVAWLEAKLPEPFQGPTVVVTHHAPHFGSIAPRFRKSIMSAAFASDLARLMGKAALWIHGHVHDSCDYVVKGTRIVCNPRGYPGERNAFDPMLIVEV
jgi:hypothetical protein